MIDWFSKPVVFVALTIGAILTFASGYFISRSVYKTRTQSCSAPVASPVLNVAMAPHSLHVVTGIQKAAIAEHQLKDGVPLYQTLSVYGNPVDIYFTVNPPELKNEVIELHVERMRYVFQLRRKYPNSSDESIEIWCPTGMRPGLALAKYTVGKDVAKTISDAYSSRLQEAIDKHIVLLNPLFAYNGSQQLLNKHYDLARADGVTGGFLAALGEVVRLGCPQAAERPRSPAKIDAYKISQYRCNYDLTKPSAPHKVALAADVFDGNPGRAGFKDYPRRALPTDSAARPIVAWTTEVRDYNPTYYMNDVLVTASWSEPFTPPGNIVAQPSFAGTLDSDENQNPVATSVAPLDFSSGFPWNPCGRTGISGRGLLGRWGPNSAADPVLTRSVKGRDGKYRVEVLLISRPDLVPSDPTKRQLAIPGGMTDVIVYNKMKKSESGGKTAARELAEETGIVQNYNSHPEVVTIYKGYSDDPRNTDNAWMQTVVMWKHLPHLPLYDQAAAINSHRRAVIQLNKVVDNLKKLKTEDEFDAYLERRATAGEDLSGLSEKREEELQACVLLTLDATLSCAEKLTSAVGSLTWEDVQDKTGGVTLDWELLRRFVRTHRAQLRSIPGWVAAESVLWTQENKKPNKSQVRSKDAVALDVLLDALAYTATNFQAADREEGIEGQAWRELAPLAGLPVDRFFAMHAYFIRRLSQIVNNKLRDAGRARAFHART